VVGGGGWGGGGWGVGGGGGGGGGEKELNACLEEGVTGQGPKKRGQCGSWPV